MNNDRIALIAGDGILPKIIAERLENLGILSILIVLQGERERFDFAHEKVFEVALGSVKKTLKLLSTNRINKAIMIGKIDKKGFLERKGFDLKALQMLRELKDGKDLTIFHIIQKEFSKIGIEILPQDEYISDMIADKGVLTKRKPTKAEMEDALFGMEHARKLASMDIGQTVVVKNQVIVAVEALEGTNETIRRGADISKKSVVVCKAARAEQDRRFDIPSVGLETIELMAQKGISLIALEAQNILIVNYEKVIEYADKKKMSIIGI